MDLTKEFQQRKEFCDILFELAKSQELLQDAYYRSNMYKRQNKAVDGKRIIDVSDAIKKLYDHVNLDIARIAYSDGADRKISGESSIENLQSQINSMQRELQKA